MRSTGFVVFRVVFQDGVESLNGVLIILPLGINVADIELRIGRELRVRKIFEVVCKLGQCKIVVASLIIPKGAGIGGFRIHAGWRTGGLRGGRWRGSAYSSSRRRSSGRILDDV